MHDSGAYCNGWSLNGGIAAGFLAFIVLALFGVQMLIRGVRGDVYDRLGHVVASRFCFIIGGIFRQLPLIAWVVLG